MKIGKPTKDSLINTAVTVASASVGVAAAQGAESIYPTEKTNRMIAKGAAVLALALGASAVSSNDVLGCGAKGFGYGAAGKTAISLVGDLMEGSTLATADATDSPLVKFAQEALQIKPCGCNTASPAPQTLQIAQLNYAAMRNQVIPMHEVAHNQYSAASFL